MSYPPKLQSITDWLAVMGQMNGPEERAAGIVASAFLENYLAWALLSRMRGNLSSAGRKRLFDDGALADFGSKIDLAHALCILGDTARADMKRIAAIRNRFAHQMEISTFAHPEIAAECSKLIVPKRGEGPHGKTAANLGPRVQFMDTIHELASALSVQCTMPAVPPPAIPRLLY